MSLQQKLFRLGIELTAQELQALAEVEARLKAQADADRFAGLAVDDSTKPDDHEGLGLDEI